MSVTEKRFVRSDGLDKVTGQGRYTADLVLPGMLHASFLYAGRPHARIRSLDTSAARALPGVLAVLTHEDVPDVLLRRSRAGSTAVREGRRPLRGGYRRRGRRPDSGARRRGVSR